jgi:hypothetical protein
VCFMTSSRSLMAEERSLMSMMEYSGDFGGIGGGCHCARERRVRSTFWRRDSSGVRCDLMSLAEGSSVNITIPVFISCVCTISLCVAAGGWKGAYWLDRQKYRWRNSIRYILSDILDCLLQSQDALGEFLADLIIRCCRLRS